MTESGSASAGFRSENTSCAKLVSVNIHFVLRGDGTGNFTETTDPDGNSSTNGFTFAQDVVDNINLEWSDNQESLRTGTGNPIPVEDVNIQYDLKGTYFHRNTTMYIVEYQVGQYSRIMLLIQVPK